MQIRDDVRIALRSFGRAPGFTITAVATLAIGIGSVTIVFALVHALLLRPLPVPAPEELVALFPRNADGGPINSMSWSQYTTLREGARGVAIAASNVADYGVADEEGASMVVGGDVSGNFFRVLGLRPAAGRFFTDDEDRVPGRDPVVVISHDFWQTRFGGRSDAIAKELVLNGRQFTIIGVAPSGFRGTTIGMAQQLWVPIAMYATLRPGSDIYSPGRQYWLDVIGRLGPGVSRTQAQAQLQTLTGALNDQTPKPGEEPRRRVTGVLVRPLTALPFAARRATTTFMAVLLGTAALVLAIAAVNIAGMMLARATGRAREISVRRALGATRGRLLVQLLTESTLLFGLGAVAAVILSAWLLQLLSRWQPPLPFPLWIDLRIEPRIALFAIAVGVGSGLLFGLAPALHGTRGHLLGALKGELSGRRGTRLRSTFVTAQLALSVVLLSTGALLTRSLLRTLSVDTGMDPAGIAVATLDVSAYGYDGAESQAFYGAVAKALRARPGVEAAGLGMMVPLGGNVYRTSLRAEGRPEGGDHTVDYNAVDSGYFGTLRVPIVLGRPFGPNDADGAPLVAIVNQEYARRMWPGQSPIGRQLHDHEGAAYQVVGVAADGKYHRLDEPLKPFVYLATTQREEGGLSVFVRHRAGAAEGLRALRQEVARLDPTVPLQVAAPLERAMNVELFPHRLGATVIAGFGVVGMLLAAIGLYGLIAFMVTLRMREIGVRMALGARRSDVARLFGGQGLRLLAIGAGAGLLLSLAAGRAVAAAIEGVAPADPVALIGVSLILGAVIMAAAWLPARRAARVDPVQVLRNE